MFDCITQNTHLFKFTPLVDGKQCPIYQPAPSEQMVIISILHLKTEWNHTSEDTHGAYLLHNFVLMENTIILSFL
jgi:hypothetical protein